jgi:hypothetical protein
LALAVMVSGLANAGIIYNFTSVTASGSNFDWKYVAQLSADQQLGPLDNTPATATDFAVVYDFLGVLSASTSSVASGLTLSTFLEATTSPQPHLQNVPDLVGLMNVHTTITGTLIPTGLTAIYTIDIISTSGQRGLFANESGQALKYVVGDATNLSVSGNTVSIEAPTANTPGAPEPVTMALMGSSLLGLGLLRLRRAKK